MEPDGPGLQGGSTEPGIPVDDATEDGLHEAVIARRARAKLFDQPYEPIRLGRYALLEQLGAGAMGVVYAAFDQSLDRKVAIKFIHPGRSHTAPAAARERFLREAKAMARVSDAHVVQVYEAGELDERVFIAMELVEGMTLRTWLDDRTGPDAWREIVHMFLAIAEGLAAAHDAGVVHRDFKPDNVLVTPGGQPKIADFGLAGLEHVDVKPEIRELSGDAGALTATGATMGTPLYMSAEQYAGQRVSTKSDQFSFCVALFEALFGQHPFAGETYMALATNVIEGNLREPPARGIPARIRLALERGLSKRPDDRFPSMHALREALDDRDATRRRWWWAGGAACVALVATFVAARASDTVEPCAGIDEKLDGVWDEATKTAIDGHLLDGAAETPAGRAWSQLRGRIDAHAEAWLEASTEGCRAHATGALSEELYDRRQTCLDLVLRETRALTTALAAVEGGWVERAAELAPDPRDLARCVDPVRLTEGPSPPSSAAERARWVHTRESLLRAEGAVGAGDIQAARAALGEAEKGAHEDPDAMATVLRLKGRLAQRSGDPKAASEILAEAAAWADRARNDDARARALVDLVWVLGVDLYLPLDAARTGTQARGALERAGDHPALLAELESGLGMTAMYAGRFDDAVDHLEKAVALVGDDPLSRPQSAALHGNLGSAELRRGRHDDAAKHLLRASELLEESLGPDHPQSVQILNNLGVALAQAGRHAEALAVHERSLAGRMAVHGRGHLETANALNGIGLALVELGRTEEAIESLERSLEIREAGGGRDEDLAEARFGLARALSGRDRQRARALARAAHELYTAPHLAAANEREASAVAAWLHDNDDENDQPEGDR